jgi:hypothetical protein
MVSFSLFLSHTHTHTHTHLHTHTRARITHTSHTHTSHTHITSGTKVVVVVLKMPSRVFLRYLSWLDWCRYRWYGTNQVVPAFPFGHGLSYTTFGYANLSFTDGLLAVSVDVTNTGSVAGAEVAQLYVTFPVDAAEPPRQLKGFGKTPVLAPGESFTVSFQLADRELSIWDVVAHDWSRQYGSFQIYVGASWGDIRLSATIVW